MIFNRSVFQWFYSFKTRFVVYYATHLGTENMVDRASREELSNLSVTVYTLSSAIHRITAVGVRLVARNGPGGPDTSIIFLASPKTPLLYV